MLLEAKRWFRVRAEDRLPALLVESRQRQAELTNELSRQVFEAPDILEFHAVALVGCDRTQCRCGAWHLGYVTGRIEKRFVEQERHLL